MIKNIIIVTFAVVVAAVTVVLATRFLGPQKPGFTPAPEVQTLKPQVQTNGQYKTFSYKLSDRTIKFKYPSDWVAEDYLYRSAAADVAGTPKANVGFRVYKKLGSETLAEIVYGGPQSAGDTCEELRRRTIIQPENSSYCFDLRSGLTDRRGVYILFDRTPNKEAQRTFDLIKQTLR